MAHIEPPKLAAWMLENLVPAAERDEALAGDLEEHFRAGRSEAWYWGQATAAVGIGWAQYLNRRRALLLFALLWSMLAPAWYVTVNSIEASPQLDHAFQIFGPFVLVGWTALHTAFLWAGLMAYQIVHAFLGKPVPRKEMRRAFWTMPLVLPPVYGITFVLTALYWNDPVPGLQHAKLAATTLGQISDVGLLADLIRIPYFLTMVAAMWRVAPRFRLAGAESMADSSWTGSSPLAKDDLSPSPLFLAFVVAAGIVNSLLCGFLLCRLPESHAPSLSSLFLRAVLFVCLGAAAGTAGAWIYWNNPASPFRDSAPVDFRMFALVCSAAWIWAPAFILFYEQITAAASFVAVIAAFALAAGLRTVPLEFLTSHRAPDHQPNLEEDLFADAILRPQFNGLGIIIALAIYVGAYAVAAGSFMTAGLLLGLAAFLVGWMRTIQRRNAVPKGFARAALRLAIFVLPAIAATVWALLDGVAYRNRIEAVKAAGAGNGARSGEEKAAVGASAHGFGGYESVILWPYPEKEEIVTPMLAQPDLLAPGTTRPLVLRFNGPYWYIQPPDQRPGLDTHQAHGSPLTVRIAANNSLPLVMEARQRLGASIPPAHCGRIVIELENRDPHLGVVAVVLLLEDSSSKGHPQLDVGRQQLITGEPETSGVQTFQFSVPLHGPIRRFDSIAVMFLPESGHQQIGPQIAVRELRLYPR